MTFRLSGRWLWPAVEPSRIDRCPANNTLCGRFKREPQPALFNQIGQRFRRAVASYADANNIPWVKFAKGEDKLATMGEHLARQAATGVSGVAAIGVAQEFQRVWTAYERTNPSGTTSWWFTKADRRLTCYYFYLWDDDFGPGFVKVCAYFPYPAKISDQRARVGQTPGDQGRPRVYRAVQRVRRLRQPRSAAGDLRPAWCGHDQRVRPTLAVASAAAVR
jgi:hypothetical protein